jgi:Predicted hydrolase (metallo-beta-lactamase superfamily)
MTMEFTLWDVEHGLAIWIKTPSGHHHCIDAGHNGENGFCPFHHMKKNHNVSAIDYLIISHPDKDHVEGIPSMVNNIGKPRVLLRNKTLPFEMKYGKLDAEYLWAYKELDERFNGNVDESVLPTNIKFNGGVNITSRMNEYEDNMNCNDTSIVSIYEYGGLAFIMPGDIEPAGWNKLIDKHGVAIGFALAGCKKILVAPHHGRPSAYSKDMIEFISPDLVLISDKFGKHETAQEYYTCAKGLEIEGEKIKSLSTKTKGRIKFILQSDGRYSILYNA